MAKIVVLEDDASTRRLVCAVLKKSGHEVLDFDNGAEGLLTVLAELPDLVVSDVEMPKMTGFEVLSEIRHTEETADTPVILLTSLSSRADIRKGMSEGADDYITKPFEPAELMESVVTQLAKLSVRRGQAVQQITGFEATAPAALEFAPLPALAPANELSLQPMQEAAPAPAQPERPRQSMGQAWAVSMEVQNDQALRDALPPKEWRMLLRQLFMPVSKDAAMRVADYLDLQESRLTLYFLDAAKDGKAGNVRAAQAVEAMVRSGAACKQWAAAQFQGMNAPNHVPIVRVVTSLHLGPIEVMRVPLDFGGERDTVVGLTAEFMQRLRDGEPRVMWRVMGTKAALAASPKIYRTGAQMEVSVGSQEVLVYALQGMHPELSLGEPLDASAWI
jgi:DNA-binding response OmpR family regulator